MKVKDIVPLLQKDKEELHDSITLLHNEDFNGKVVHVDKKVRDQLFLKLGGVYCNLDRIIDELNKPKEGK